MQFLLAAVNAKYIHTNPAIYSLRAYAGEEFRPFISLAEYTINQSIEEILGDLYRKKPEVIGFSCYIWNWKLIIRLLPELSKVLPETELWLGGPEVSFEGEQILKDYPMVKGIMVGEGEETFKELIAYYRRRDVKRMEESELSQIHGLLLRSGFTGSRELINLNDLPFIYEDLFPENFEELQNKILYYETSRGCPFRCSYCLSSMDKEVRLRSLETVKKELQFFLDHRVKQVKLTDRTFNCYRKHALSIWRYLKEHDNGVTNFHFEIAAELIGEEELTLLAELRPGQVQLEIGVQTTNPQTLKEINRTGDNVHIARVVRRIQENHNIHIHLDLIAGLPWEGYESFQDSFCAVYTMRPQQLQLGFLKVLKGTAIWMKAREYGIACREEPPYEVLYSKWITYGEILRLKQIEEMVELYFNTNQFTRTLPVLEQEFETPFAMFAALAEFYDEKGYFLQSPARSRRYEVLLEFIEERVCAEGPNNGEENSDKRLLYRELMTFDYYLRENAKSRPGFASDLTEYRDCIWAFYQEEEKEPKLLSAYQGFHARQMMRMTHVEVFHHLILNEGAEPELQLVLFDYGKRDALTGDAVTAIIKKDYLQI